MRRPVRRSVSFLPLPFARPPLLRIAARILAGSGLVLGLAAGLPAHAQEQAPRAGDAPIERVLAGANARAGRVEVEQAVIESVSRPLFKDLRGDAAWGPEHPVWTRLLPRFQQELARLATPDEAYGNARLKEAMRTRLSAAELTEIAALLEDPRLAAASVRLRDMGLDVVSTARSSEQTRAPQLYSAAEKEATGERLVAVMTSRRLELQAAMPELQPFLAALRNPANLKYQRLVADLLRAALQGDVEDPAARERFQAFVTGWRERVRD